MFSLMTCTCMYSYLARLRTCISHECLLLLFISSTQLPLNPSPVLSVFDFDPEEIARQLTLIDCALFSKIKPAELLNQAWQKARHRHRAQNILRLVERVNNLTLWVATTILSQKVRLILLSMGIMTVLQYYLCVIITATQCNSYVHCCNRWMKIICLFIILLCRILLKEPKELQTSFKFVWYVFITINNRPMYYELFNPVASP